ncbi:MAG: hypothetical protein ACE5HU_00145 [Acidobacteriota bacterium]
MAGLTESIFYRLVPEPTVHGTPSLIEKLQVSLNRAGSLTFLLAFILVLAALVTVSRYTLRERPWPSGLNGFLAFCFIALVGLGLSASMARTGPLFAVVFTVVAVVTLLLISMHAFTVSGSRRVRAFAVCYNGAVICSALIALAVFLQRFPAGSWPIPLDPLRRVLLWAGVPAQPAGVLLLGAASAFAFLSFADLEDVFRKHRTLGVLTLLAAGLAGFGLAAGSLLAPTRLGFLGPAPARLAVLLLSFALFLGALTAGLNLIEPRRRPLGYGVLLLVLAGFPHQIAYQDLLMVLGASLVLSPLGLGPCLQRPLRSGSDRFSGALVDRPMAGDPTEAKDQTPSLI